MAIELTPEELKYARTQVNIFRYGSKHGRRMRWLKLVYAVFLIAIGGAIFYQDLRVVRHVPDGLVEIIMPQASTKPASESDVRTAIEIQSDFTLLAVLGGAVASVMCLSGLYLFLTTVLTWNKHSFYSIASKLLQEKLDEIEKATP